MNRIVAVFISSFIFTIPAQAQTWAQQQENYNRFNNQEVEAFQQREEMERMQQKHERDMQELQREMQSQRTKMEVERSRQEMQERVRGGIMP